MDNQLSWDCHMDLVGNHTGFARETDQPFAALLTDLEQRGLLEDTLVICGGEFGRLPSLAKGRQTWPRSQSSRLYHLDGWAAGLRAASITARPTIWTQSGRQQGQCARLPRHPAPRLGIDHEKLTFAFQGLDQRLTGVEKARVVTEMFS